MYTGASSLRLQELTTRAQGSLVALGNPGLWDETPLGFLGLEVGRSKRSIDYELMTDIMDIADGMDKMDAEERIH